MIDEDLMQEVREQLEDQGLDEDSIDFYLADMRDEGAFDVPEDETW